MACAREAGNRRPRGVINPANYLAGLLVCAGCGEPMIARADRKEYYCGTWDKHRVRGALAESPCERNGVRHTVLEGYIDRYLEETGRRLELLTEGPDDKHLTGRLEGQEETAWRSFKAGFYRPCKYLRDHHPEEYVAILREQSVPQEAGGPGPDDFVDAVVGCYRWVFDPSAVETEDRQLESEHEALMGQWADLPTKLAKEKAKQRFAELEGRIEELRRQLEDAAEIVEQHYREVRDLQSAIADTRLMMQSETGAQALRHRAEALRGLLCRIECEFVLTGKAAACVVRGKKRRAGGPGNTRSKLVALNFLPVVGDSMRLEANERQPSYGQP
jgi:hypothetical protein